MDNKVFEGKVMPMHESHGWYIQTKPDINQPHDRGIRSAATILQPLIGKNVRIIVEVIE